MLDSAATSNVGRAKGRSLEGISGLFLAFLYHELDDIHVDGCSEDCV